MKINWTNDGIYQYLDILIDEQTAIDNFTYQMLCELPTGYLKCVHQQFEPSLFRYGLNGKRSLQNYIRKSANQAEMMQILKQIVDRLLALSDYLIDIRQVYLSDQTIFVDILTEEVQLLVLPCDQYDDGVSFKQWLETHINTYRHTLYRGVQGLALYNFVKSEHFCLSGLSAFIEENSRVKLICNEFQDENVIEDKNIQKKYKKKVKNNKKMSISSYVALFLLQLFIVTIYIAIFLLLPKITSDLIIARLGALLILLSVDLLITKSIIKQYSLKLSISKTIARQKRPKASIKQENKNKQVVAETMLLAKSKQNAYLFDAVTNKPYPIKADNTLIGRQQATVDICLDSQAIGRQHCKIVKRDNVYWLTDLASKNGTFINDIKIAEQDVRQLNSGDKLRLADSEFVFINGDVQNRVERVKANAL